jgi:hypothetical protein
MSPPPTPNPAPKKSQVAAAVSSAFLQLNTNSRYLSTGLVDLSEQLLDVLPKNLEVRVQGGGGRVRPGSSLRCVFNPNQTPSLPTPNQRTATQCNSTPTRPLR